MMIESQVLYPLILFLATAFAWGTAALAWSRRQSRGAKAFFGLMLAAGWWAFTYAFELLNPALEAKLIWVQFQYLGLATLPVFWFLFSLAYTDQLDKVPFHYRAGLFVIPSLTVSLIFTNPLHYLIWQEATVVFSEGLAFLRFVRGAWFWLHLVYSYALVMLGLLAMLRFLVLTQLTYHRPLLIMVLGALVAIILNGLYVLERSPYPHLDMTPLSFAASGFLFGWAAFRYRWLDVVPIARYGVVEHLSDAVMILDARHRIVDMNVAAQELIGQPLSQVLGVGVSHFLPQYLEAFRRHQDAVAERENEGVIIEHHDRFYDMRITALRDRRDQLRGRAITLRDITEQRQLANSLKDQMKRTELLLAVARSTSRTPTLDATLQNIIDITVPLTGAEEGYLLLVDEEHQITRGFSTAGEISPELIEKVFQRAVAEGLQHWVLRENKVIAIPDTREDERWIDLMYPAYEARPIRSALGAPLIQEGRALGVLVLRHSDVGHFDTDDAKVMRIIAPQITLAIRNAQIYEEQRRLADQQSTLYEVLRTLQRAQQVTQVSELAARAVARLTGWPLVALLSPDRTGSAVTIEAAAGEITLPPDWRTSLYAGAVGEAWRARETQYVPDLQASPSALPELEARSLLIVPLSEADQIGVMLCIASDEPWAFDAEARLLAESLREVLNLARKSARFYTGLQKELRERQHVEDRLWMTVRKTDALYRVSRALIGSQQLDDVLNAAVEEVVTALGADRVMLITVDLERERIVDFMVGGPGAGDPVPIEFKALMAGLGGWVIREGVPALSKKGEVDPRESPEVQEFRAKMNAGAIITVPLIVQGEPAGVMTAINNTTQRDFTQKDVDLMTAMASQVSVALYNAQLFQSIATEQRRLQAVLASSRDGVILLSLTGKILVLNQAAVELMSAAGSPDEWVGRNLLDYLWQARHQTPDLVRATIEEMRHFQAADAEPGEGEFGVGNRILHWLNLPAIGAPDAATADRPANKPFGRLLVLRDVTEEHILEQMREDLTHTMVHDLRNPLTNIHSALQFMTRYDRESLSSEQMEVLEISINSTERMTKLVNAILDINRLESGRMPLNRIAFSLEMSLLETWEMQRPQAEQKAIVLRYDIPDEAALVYADVDLIERVFQNLLSNAVKFTPAGGEIIVWAERRAGAPGKTFITVQDSGAGVPEKIRERVFKKFVTGPQEGRGSGLGLTFCKMVLEAHDERIWLDPQSPGTGATFTFTLPLAEAND
ncbi:MAG: histidine kinase N-terminal 7TM domain-containing protein [Anaerolineales bacterium]